MIVSNLFKHSIYFLLQSVKSYNFTYYHEYEGIAA